MNDKVIFEIEDNGEMFLDFRLTGCILPAGAAPAAAMVNGVLVFFGSETFTRQEIVAWIEEAWGVAPSDDISSGRGNFFPLARLTA